MSKWIDPIAEFFRRIWSFLKKNRKISIPAGVVLVIIVLVLSRGRGRSTSSLFQTEPIQRGSLTATVGATGSVRARQSATLLWQTTGTVEDVNAEVGDPVKQGQVLAALDKSTVPQNIILAEADLASAQKALDDLMNSDTARAQAVIALKKAQNAYQKAYDYRMSLNGKVDLKKIIYVNVGGHLVPEVKYFKGYADEDTIAKADDDLALAKAKLDDAQRTYDHLKDGPNKDDLAAAQARVNAAQATLDMARILAPFTGTVTQAQPIPGDQVSPGKLAFRVDDLSDLLVDVEVSEVDINSIQVGQPVDLTFDAILGGEYHGQVMEVSQAGDVVQGVVNFTVTVRLTDADQQVKPGMTAAVNIVVQQVENQVLVPNRAVRLVDGKRVVYILKDGQPQKVEVSLGPSSDTMSVVLPGSLQEGDLVILNPPFQSGGPGGGPFGPQRGGG